jgi:phage baseplate assembly protein W
MLTIKDFDGADLVANPPEAASYFVTAQNNTRVTIQARIVEDDTLLTGMYVNGTLNWNDGSLPIVYDAVSGTLTVEAQKGLGNGNYIVSLTAQNYKAPIPETVRVNFPVHVVQEATIAPPPHLIFGPILPRDGGFPGPDQWNFNTESDLLILESSVRMLLLTSKGERIQEPEYGTSIRRLLFEQKIAAIESAISEEITDALTKWEPRLQLQALSVVRNPDPSVTVTATFLSKQSNQPFITNLQFSR